MTIDRRTFIKVAGAQAGLIATGAAAATAAAAAPEAAPFLDGKAPAFNRAAPDVIVVGAGAFGGWTALNLQKAGMKVLLIDAFGPGNSRATSGDETRGVRSSYGNIAGPRGELWMKWARRSIEKWKQWDAEWGKEMKIQLFYTTGDLIFRADTTPETTANDALWTKLKVPHEFLKVEEVAYRYPQFDLTGIKIAQFEPDAGVVRARRACEAVFGVFRQLGGDYLMARAWPTVPEKGKMPALQLSTGDLVSAGTYVFAVGPWFPYLFVDLMGPKMRTSLGNVYYMGAAPGDLRWTFPNIPSWSFPGVTGWPGLPTDNRGFRIRTGGGAVGDPDFSSRWIPPEAHEARKRFIAQRFPALINAPLLETRSCHYESSVGSNFIIDKHPDMDNVWFVGAGNSEGFKQGPTIGEYAANRILGQDKEPELAAMFKIPAENYATGGGRGAGNAGRGGQGQGRGGTGNGRGGGGRGGRGDTTAAGRGRGRGTDTTAAGRGRGTDTTAAGRGRGSDTTATAAGRGRGSDTTRGRK